MLWSQMSDLFCRCSRIENVASVYSEIAQGPGSIRPSGYFNHIDY